MKLQKYISILFIVVLLFLFSSCTSSTNSENTITVNMKISASNTVIFDDEVILNNDEPTVMKAFQQAMNDYDEFPIVVFDNDENPLHVKDIGEYVDSVDKFWEFRVNDIPFEDIKGAAGVYAIKDGDKIYWEYGVAVEDSVNDEEENPERPFDKDGIYYKEYLQEHLDELEIGDIYWDYDLEAYSIKPRGTFRSCIIYLVADPFDGEWLAYWDAILDYIATLSKIYPCSICVENPANPSAHLVVISLGEIGYSVF